MYTFCHEIYTIPCPGFLIRHFSFLRTTYTYLSEIMRGSRKILITFGNPISYYRQLFLRYSCVDLEEGERDRDPLGKFKFRIYTYM